MDDDGGIAIDASYIKLEPVDPGEQILYELSLGHDVVSSDLHEPSVGVVKIEPTIEPVDVELDVPNEHFNEPMQEFSLTIDPELFELDTTRMLSLTVEVMDIMKLAFNQNRLLLNAADPSELLDQLYFCTECVKSFPDAHTVKEHQHTHFHSCTLCNFKCKRHDGLIKHKSRIHGEKYAYSCEHCAYTTLISHNLERHMMQHNSNTKTLRCQTCCYRTTNREYFARHLRKCEDRNTDQYQCRGCDFTSKRKSGMQEHEQIHHSIKHFNSINCDLCDFYTIYPSKLRRHKLTHLGTRALKCPLCIYETNYQMHLDRHKKVHGDSKRKLCNLRHHKDDRILTPQPSEIKKIYKDVSQHFHVSGHSGSGRSWHCLHCNYVTSKMGLTAMRTHVMKAHLNIQPYQCKICGLKGVLPCVVRQHLKTHDKDDGNQAKEQDSKNDRLLLLNCYN